MSAVSPLSCVKVSSRSRAVACEVVLLCRVCDTKVRPCGRPRSGLTLSLTCGARCSREPVHESCTCRLTVMTEIRGPRCEEWSKRRAKPKGREPLPLARSARGPLLHVCTNRVHRPPSCMQPSAAGGRARGSQGPAQGHSGAGGQARARAGPPARGLPLSPVTCHASAHIIQYTSVISYDTKPAMRT